MMNSQEQSQPDPGPSRSKVPLVAAVLLLAALPSGYLYLTGRQAQMALQRENQELVQRSEALTDSLDGARTQLLLDGALNSFRAGDHEGARALASEFFDRVDRRSRRTGAAPKETGARLELLSRRDQTITELSRQTPAGGRILEELATLHLELADPDLKARTPLTTFRAGPGDTLLDGDAPLGSPQVRPDTGVQRPGRLRPDTTVGG
ncbi:MAG: hypothetical protein HKO65_14275 [Gemmatimonadetes bacterium]|nr:hypothetical protein [Gemmatimonadota bacterium]NNM06253.1 hypothetical protein [Gemmatimonadota bacterium]